MNDITESGVVTALRRQMTISTARQMASTGNLANYDTPGYKTKEVTFDDALGLKLTQPNSTYPTHQGGAVLSGVQIQEAKDLPERRDGNNVQIDRELLNMSGAASDFAAAQTALTAKFRLVRYAINEGR